MDQRPRRAAGADRTVDPQSGHRARGVVRGSARRGRYRHQDRDQERRRQWRRGPDRRQSSSTGPARPHWRCSITIPRGCRGLVAKNSLPKVASGRRWCPCFLRSASSRSPAAAVDQRWPHPHRHRRGIPRIRRPARLRRDQGRHRCGAISDHAARPLLARRLRLDGGRNRWPIAGALDHRSYGRRVGTAGVRGTAGGRAAATSGYGRSTPDRRRRRRARHDHCLPAADDHRAGAAQGPQGQRARTAGTRGGQSAR